MYNVTISMLNGKVFQFVTDDKIESNTNTYTVTKITNYTDSPAMMESINPIHRLM